VLGFQTRDLAPPRAVRQSILGTSAPSGSVASGLRSVNRQERQAEYRPERIPECRIQFIAAMLLRGGEVPRHELTGGARTGRPSASRVPDSKAAADGICRAAPATLPWRALPTRLRQMVDPIGR
jgi:hypothetical protein